MRIVIIGAGICGLTAALSLHKAGFAPVVYEAAAAFAPLFNATAIRRLLL